MQFVQVTLLCLMAVSITLPTTAQEAPAENTAANLVENVEQLPQNNTATPLPDTLNTPDVTNDASQPIQERLSWKGSLMFNNKQLNVIYALLDGVTISDDFLAEPKAAPVVREEKGIDRNNIRVTRIVPGYNLETILYISPKNWSFWMNGTRYSSKDPLPAPLVFADINNTHLVLEWRNPDFNDVTPTWKDDFTPYNQFESALNRATSISASGKNWDYISTDGAVLLDSRTGTVQFALQPNQSFKSYTLQVVEGRSDSFYVTFIPGKGNDASTLLPLDATTSNMTEAELQQFINDQATAAKSDDDDD